MLQIPSREETRNEEVVKDIRISTLILSENQTISKYDFSENLILA